MKKMLCLVLAALLALALCVPAFAEANTEVTGTLRIIGPGALNGPGAEGANDLITGQFKPGYNKLYEEFNKDYPNVKVEFTETPWDNWTAVLQTAAAGGTADILLHGSMLTDISMDLTPYLEKSPEVLEAMTTGAEYYRDPQDYTKIIPTGISYVVDPYFAMLDSKLFEEWGVEMPTADWTWEDLLDLAAKTTGTNPVTGEQNYGAFPFILDANSGWKAYSSYCAAKGIENHQFTSVNKFDAGHTFSSEENVSALNYFNELVKFAPPSYVEGLGNEKCGRADNDIAIMLGEGMLNAYANTLVDEVSDRYVFLPLPVNEDQSDAKYSSFTGTNSIAISKSAPNPDLAWTFISWLITDDDAQQWIVDNLCCPSTYKGIEMLKEKGYPFMDAYEEVMSNFWDIYTIAQTNTIDIAYGNVSSLYYSNITEMYSGAMSPADCGQSIDDGIAEYQAMN